jgi:putative DNA primase/helicase
VSGSKDEGGNVVPLHSASTPSAAPPSPPGGQGASAERKRGKRGPPPGFYDNLTTLLTHFVLIHGTDTAWDGVHRIVIKVAHLRLTYGNDAVKAWLGSPDRKMVMKDHVVFDPTLSVDRRTHVNLFDGFETKPAPGKCDKLLALLRHLVAGDQAVHEWILRWAALPLQRPGAKMATAVIMHGAEGTGKNLFWSAVLGIYGRYGTMIGQAQLDSEFNGWLSAKLFVVGNEVLGRKEKWELKGALKHLVTEDNVYINEKNMPERVERNHANLVFLSNELQPLVLNTGDRRYMVIDCWSAHPDGKAFYESVRDELAAGGQAALYEHLLSLPLGDFHPHTRPIETEAKRDLVELGKDEPERFLEHWRTGLIDLPYGVATAEHLYASFRRWCQRQGERHVPSLNRFGRTCKAKLRSAVKRLALTSGAGIGERTFEKQWTLYWDDDSVPDSCEDFDRWLRAAAQKFYEAAFDPRDNRDDHG